jgi:predicted ATPase
MVIGRPAKLYGRSQEQYLLGEAYKHRTFCLISGEPGTGKTSLALSLRDRVDQDGGYFVCGKFHQSQSRSPDPAIVSAFTEFAQQVEERGHVDEMRRRIHATVQSESSILTEMIPALKNLVGDQQHTTLSGENAVLRFGFVFRAFLLAVASPEEPIVICVDDLQWADACSLQLMASLIPSTRDRGIFFVATSRNDVGNDSILSSALRDLEREKVHICHISLTNLPVEVVAEMLVDMLSLDPRDADSLSSFLQSRTDGNILFLLELLGRLQEEGFLIESELRRWDFSNSALNREIVSLQQLLTEKMRALPQHVQDVLKIAAFLHGGSTVDQDLLSRLSSIPVAESLDAAAERQLFVFECDSYRWVHDEIEAAAYALVHPNQVQETHLAIGRQLWKSMEEDELKSNIFVVLNQLVRGIDLIQTQNERNAVASLCLWAGETAVRSSTFRTARVYLDLGLELLGKDLWRDQYELSIALHNLAAECAYCAGGTSLCRVDNAEINQSLTFLSHF